MKRFFILFACFLFIFACGDRTPRPRTAAEREMFVQADKNFSTAMLPSDKYFERNGAPDEVRLYKELKENYLIDIKTALLRTDPAARGAALRTADDNYLPQINALQNAVRLRASNGYISNLEDKNAASRLAARRIFGPLAEAEEKAAQDKMMAGIKAALAEPDPMYAREKIKDAGGNFQTDLTNIVNKYAAQQKIPPDKTVKIFEPYNNGAPGPVQARADRRPVITGPRPLVTARGSGLPRPVQSAPIDVSNNFPSPAQAAQTSAQVPTNFDAMTKPLIDKMAGNFGDKIAGEYEHDVAAVKNNMNIALAKEPDPSKQQKILDDAAFQVADLTDYYNVKGSAPNHVDQVNQKYFDRMINALSARGKPGETSQVQALKDGYNKDAQKIAGDALAKPKGTNRLAFYNGQMQQIDKSYSEQLNKIINYVNQTQAQMDKQRQEATQRARATKFTAVPPSK